MRSLLIAATVAAVLASPARAAENKIDFTAVIVDENDRPFEECLEPPEAAAQPDCKKRQAVTLGVIAMRALAIPEQNITPDESLKRGQLALSVRFSNGAELTAEEIALIKKRIAAAYGPLVVVRAFRLLDPAVK